MKYNYQKICKDCLKNLTPRTIDVIERRFGLQAGQRETLEAIGEEYGRTRERIRQIEEDGISKISDKINNYNNVFKYFKNNLASFGGLKKEDDLLNILGGNKYQNHVYFLLNNSNYFNRFSEDNNFYSFWATNKDSFNQAKKVVKLTISKLKKEKKTLSLNELSRGQKINKNVFASYIGISKEIEKDKKDKFGLNNWIEINPRGVKDRAYLVLKEAGEPMHFTKVACRIGKETHTATVHNELIKDDRFVLVGRGLYALKEWGYQQGVVKDVIAKILKDSKKPLRKQEILKKVLVQRFVKENTVVLNLQDRDYFSRNAKGKYTIKEA